MSLHEANAQPPLPAEFLDRLHEIVPTDHLKRVLNSFTLPSSVGFRVNSLRAVRSAVLDALRDEGLHPAPVAWWDLAFYVPFAERPSLLESAPYRNEEIYVQNLSSMIPPLVLGPQPGERILDLAAAPGSKTLQIAALVGEGGEIAAVEKVRARFFRLRQNLERQGAGFVKTFLQDGERVWRYRPEYFDRVLLDAPCSSEGRFRTDEPESHHYWSRRKIREMSRKQRRLLFSAVHALRPGGCLVYSTCAFSPEENEAAIAYVLEHFGDALEVEPIGIRPPLTMPGLSHWRDVTFPEAVRHAMRVLPSAEYEGFFICRLRKIATTHPPLRSR